MVAILELVQSSIGNLNETCTSPLRNILRGVLSIISILGYLNIINVSLCTQ